MRDEELAGLERAHAADGGDEVVARRLASARERTGDVAAAIELLLLRDTTEVSRLVAGEPLAFATAAARRPEDAVVYLRSADEAPARIAMAGLVARGELGPLLALASDPELLVRGTSGWWAQEALRTTDPAIPCSPSTLRVALEGELYLAGAGLGADGPPLTVELVPGHPLTERVLGELRELATPEGGWVAWSIAFLDRAGPSHRPWIVALADVQGDARVNERARARLET